MSNRQLVLILTLARDAIRECKTVDEVLAKLDRLIELLVK